MADDRLAYACQVQRDSYHRSIPALTFESCSPNHRQSSIHAGDWYVTSPENLRSGLLDSLSVLSPGFFTMALSELGPVNLVLKRFLEGICDQGDCLADLDYRLLCVQDFSNVPAEERFYVECGLVGFH